MSVHLGAVACPSRAQLNGFKSRVLRGAAVSPRHLYATEWRALTIMRANWQAVLVLGDGPVPEGEELGWQPVQKAPPGTEMTAAVACVATQQGSLALAPLFALEAALALVQALVGGAPVSEAWLLTAGAQVASRPEHAGLWGLAR